MKDEHSNEVEDCFKLDKDTVFSVKKNKEGKQMIHLSGKGKTTWVLTSESEDVLNKWKEIMKEILIKNGAKISHHKSRTSKPGAEDATEIRSDTITKDEVKSSDDSSPNETQTNTSESVTREKQHNATPTATATTTTTSQPVDSSRSSASLSSEESTKNKESHTGASGSDTTSPITSPTITTTSPLPTGPKIDKPPVPPRLSSKRLLQSPSSSASSLMTSDTSSKNEPTEGVVSVGSSGDAVATTAPLSEGPLSLPSASNTTEANENAIQKPPPPSRPAGLKVTQKVPPPPPLRNVAMSVSVTSSVLSPSHPRAASPSTTTLSDSRIHSSAARGNVSPLPSSPPLVAVNTTVTPTKRNLPSPPSSQSGLNDRAATTTQLSASSSNTKSTKAPSPRAQGGTTSSPSSSTRPNSPPPPSSVAPKSPPSAAQNSTSEPKTPIKERTVSSAPSAEQTAHRTKIAKEILSTEQTFVKCLRSIVQYYMQPLLKQSEAIGVSSDTIKALFPTNLETILQFNQELLKQLEERIKDFTPNTTLGDVFLKLTPFLKMYNEYSSNYQQALNTYNTLRKENQNFVKELENCRKASGSQLTLEDLIIMPVQRIPRYKLLLEDFLKHTDKTHPDYENIKSALLRINEVAAYVNESVRKSDNAKKLISLSVKGANFDNLIAPHRYMIREGPLKVIEAKKKEIKHFFLFNDLLVHIKESLLKEGRDLSSNEYAWPINLIWLPETETNLKKVLLIGPNGSMYVKFPDISWLNDLRDAIKRQCNLLNENDETANNNNSHRKGKYTFPSGATYEGDWIDGRREGMGTLSYMGSLYTGEFLQDKKHGKGKIQYATGHEYDGMWKDDLPCGKGVLTFGEDGGCYEGDWLNGKRHGFGKLVFPNGDVYEGTFENDVINGKGKLIAKSGLIYDGEWKDDRFHGKGRLQYPNGMVYEGTFDYGLKAGHGVLKYPTGAVYEGDWVNDQREGKGVYKEKDGSMYEGEWVNDLPDGQGTKTYPDGTKYSGHFSKGLRKGQGVCIYSNGTRYEGSWSDDKRHGVGNFKDIDGSQYQGEWACDHKEGKGIATYISGARYDGYWHNDKYHKSGIYTGSPEDFVAKYEGEFQYNKFHGKGTLYFCNGDIYKGFFKDHKFHGLGTFTFANGTTLVGKWNYGIKEGKLQFTNNEKETFHGSVPSEKYGNLIEPDKSDAFPLHIPPQFPILFIYFDIETSRTCP